VQFDRWVSGGCHAAIGRPVARTVERRVGSAQPKRCRAILRRRLISSRRTRPARTRRTALARRTGDGEPFQDAAACLRASPAPPVRRLQQRRHTSLTIRPGHTFISGQAIVEAPLNHRADGHAESREGPDDDRHGPEAGRSDRFGPVFDTVGRHQGLTLRPATEPCTRGRTRYAATPGHRNGPPTKGGPSQIPSHVGSMAGTLLRGSRPGPAAALRAW
jgi:hypothetical protein